MSKRYALCLFGLAGTRDKAAGSPKWTNTIDKTTRVIPTSPEVLHVAGVYWRMNVLAPNVDVFIHTFSDDRIEDMKTIFRGNLKSFEAVHQIPFFDVETKFPEELRRKHKHRHYTIAGRYYSMKRSINIMSGWEVKKGFTYDGVMISRFDVSWVRPFDFSRIESGKVYVTDITRFAKSSQQKIEATVPFNAPCDHEWRERNLGKFIAVPHGYPHDGHGIYDSWMATDSATSKQLATIYDELDGLVNDPRSRDYQGRVSTHNILVAKLLNMNVAPAKLIRMYDFYTHCPVTRWYDFKSKM